MRIYIYNRKRAFYYYRKYILLAYQNKFGNGTGMDKCFSVMELVVVVE